MALPTLDATFASAADLPRRQMLAQWLVNLQYSGSVADYWTLPEHYLWAKIAVAAGAPRSEADYISLPKNYVWSDLYNAVSGSSGSTIDRGEKEAIGWIAAAVRGDAGDPAKVATYINWPWRYQVASIITALAVDTDAQSFITTSGATDIEAIDQFVKGVKNLGLWDSMVAWPLRSTQNAGTGTTAYSLGGLGAFNGTLTNGPAWGANGVALDGSNDFINIGDSPDLRVGDNDFTVVAWVNPDLVNGVQRGIVAKESSVGSTGQREFMLVIHGSNTFRFYVRPNTTVDFNVAGPTAVAGQNQFVAAWHDSVNDNISIQVNNGSVASLAYSQGVFSSTNPLQIGAQGTSTFWDGSIAFVAQFRAVLTDDQKTFLYNSGTPLI